MCMCVCVCVIVGISMRVGVYCVYVDCVGGWVGVCINDLCVYVLLCCLCVL